MKFTDKEVEEQFQKVWPHGNFEWSKVFIEVLSNTENNIQVKVSSMYDPPGLTFAQLMLLSEIFGTKQIDAGEKVADSGCETCDYGSSYGFVIDIKSETVMSSSAGDSNNKQ